MLRTLYTRLALGLLLLLLAVGVLYTALSLYQGGDISVQNLAAGGAAFCIRLPVRR